MDPATREPDQFTAGDTVRWTRTLSDYLPEDGWILSYTFSSLSGKFPAVATDNGDGKHLVTLDAATTLNYVPATYDWQAVVTLAAERFTVDRGETQVLADFATSAPLDTRSTAQQLLDAVEAALGGRMTEELASYSLEGVSVALLQPEELLAARSKLKAEVAREEQAARIKKGLGHSGKILVRL